MACISFDCQWSINKSFALILTSSLGITKAPYHIENKSDYHCGKLFDFVFTW